MKLKKLLIGITILTLATASLAGCAKKNNGEKLSEINLTYVKSPLNVPSIIQKQDDLFGKEFKKDNIKVNFHEITTGPEQTQALAAGEIDFLHALGGTSALIAASNGVELKILNTYSRSPKGFMILTNNNSIKSAADLVGKKVAGPKGTILHQVLISALDKEGLSMDDVEFVNMGIPEASAALSDGSIDAALIAGPAALKAMKSGSKLVANGEGLVDGIIVTAVSTDFAEKHPEIVERFMKVEKETLEYVNNNFDEAMEKVAKEVDLSLEETKELYVWYDFSLDITDKDISSLEDTQDFLIKNKLQEKKVNIKELIYNAK
ncbi:NrtA/SsuA/CpmA family ABC transporter substrate-binding protein [Clostridioides difficile]|uniref:ABC transporter sulfonate-family extracellular solute-binding protein n=4 Tax=Clostridioides difficile TaxID=1496 RepID=A0AAX3GZL7_CLODI|nr:NrtA/SsuA/CpmA family ABC transporter substrate-binding protein [Clostridioides difficile]AVD37251.1 aliphatic sulfonate ABC transporter substrate-binding protein [Clostridioides difficile]AVD39296.1 aliphatic sulfonate ABC transporter substrate-binding protein [Clostridioides difficile]AVD42818.1 aliphatic sulfonate ABC transporter substrate-binding protein [Clostridioides difficile]AXU69405.1 ABC transporter substrate-binding protein [Clostridioides difficile]AXU91537.1 ABC transporter su